MDIANIDGFAARMTTTLDFEAALDVLADEVAKLGVDAVFEALT